MTAPDPAPVERGAGGSARSGRAPASPTRAGEVDAGWLPRDEGPVTVVFGTSGYGNTVRRWIAHACNVGCSHYRIVCLDDGLLRALRGSGEGARAVALTDLLSDASAPDFEAMTPAARMRCLSPLRVRVYRLLAAAGCDFVHSDADAFWLRDPRPWLLREGRCDLLVSQGTTFPAAHYRRHRFTACAGFFLCRANARTRDYFAAVEALLPACPDDQACMNAVLLRDPARRWRLASPAAAVRRAGRWTHPPLARSYGALARAVVAWASLRGPLNLACRACRLDFVLTSPEVIEGRFASGLTVGRDPDGRGPSRRVRAVRGAAGVPHLGEQGRMKARANGAPAVDTEAGWDAAETYPMALAAQLTRARGDLAAGARAWRLWGWLEWAELCWSYRRTGLGPFWGIVGGAVTVGVMGVLFGRLFALRTAEYVPYLAVGMVVWRLMTALIQDGFRVFVDNAGRIKETNLPLSVHLYGVVWRHLLAFGHYLVALTAAGAAFSILPGRVGLLAAAGVALVCLNGAWVALLAGTVSARFRDFPSFATRTVGIVFLVTPVLWTADRMPERALYVDFNPFYHCLEVVRGPLLGERPAALSWAVAAATAVAGWTAAFVVFARLRGRIAYWL